MKRILRAVFAMVLVLCAAGTSLAGDLQKQFSLSGVSGSRESVQFDVAMHHDNIVIEAEWTGQATDLALMLNGPGRTSYYARKDGKSVLRVEYKVAQADIAKGKTWVATIANFSNKGPANGTMRIWYPDRRAVIDSITPARGKHGDIITIKGEGFSNVDEVGLGNANRGGLAEFRLNIKSRTPDTIEAVVAGPAGSHKVVVTSLDRQSYAQSNGTFAVFFEPMKDTGSKPPPPMKKDKADRAAKLKNGLLKVLDKIEDRRQISRAGASKLRTGIQKGDFKNAMEFLDEAQDVMIKEAEDAVGGPVDDSIVMASMKSGKSIKEVAMDWSHCHNEESPKSGIGVNNKHQDYSRNGKARGSIGIGRGKIDNMGDDRNTDCMSASGAKAKYHSHIVVDSKAIGIGDIGKRMKRMQLAMNGKRPSVIPRHMHRDKGFLTGKIYIPPQKKDDDLLDDVMDVAEDVAEVAVDVGKWSKEHAATIGSGVKIVAIVTVAVIAAPVTGGGSLAIAAVVAGPVLKEVAVILVDTEAVDVEDMGLKKKDVIDGIGKIPA